MTGTAMESLLKRDRVIVTAGLVGVTAVAWIYLAVLAAGMDDVPAGMGGGAAMMAVKPWTAIDFVLMFVMWAVMMVGMMAPSAAPMILLYAMVSRKQRERGHTLAPTGAFASGYLAIWAGFSLVATLLQWAFGQAALLSPMMVGTSAWLGGVLLIAAGIYQWTPLKNACLEHCRSPIHFISAHWRNGTLGALRMGIEHGAFCVGCCWVLMGLLFVGGVMNLLWIAAVAAFVLVEKVLPAGVQAGRASGFLLVAAGVFFVLQA